MAIFPIRNLGAIGIIKDRDPYDLPPNAFSGGSNIVVENGAVAKAYGHKSITAINNVAYGCGWFAEDNSCQVYAKNDGSIHKLVGSTVTAFDAGITNNGNGYYQSVQVGSHLILNNGIDAPFTAAPGDASLSSLANWDATWRCEVIKPYNSFLVAIGMQKGAVEYPMMVKWSDAIEPNSTIADWNEVDITTLAGENTLSGGGRILDIEQLGDQMMIYTADSVTSMQYVGGQYVFNWRNVFNGSGIAAQGCVTEFDGQHFCVDLDDIYVHNGTTKQSVGNKRIVKALSIECGDMSAIKLHKNASNNEIWVLYKTKSSDQLNKAWVWNWVDDVWTNIELPNVTNVFQAPRIEGVVLFDDIDDSYNDIAWRYSTLNPEFGDKQTMWVRSDGLVDIHGLTYSSNGSVYPSYVEQIAIDLDEVTGQGTSNIKQLKRIYPQISGEGTVRIRVGGTNSPQGSIRWANTVDYDISSNHKVDVRSTYRYLALRVEQNTPGHWKLTGWDLEIDPVRYGR